MRFAVFILLLLVAGFAWANDDAFLSTGDFDLMPTFTRKDAQNPYIVENQFGDIDEVKFIFQSVRRKTVYIPRNGQWLMASILSADPLNNSAEDLALLQKARDTVFSNFRKASPDYTEEQWARVKQLDPLFRPDTYVIIIQEPQTREVVANLKLVYDNPDHPLPAEIRFPGQFKRSAPEQGSVSMFNVVQGKVHKYTNGPVGGAIQVMELFGPGYTSELVFLANFVLAQHRTVKYRHNGRVYEAYPKEVISYGIESEMGAFHSKIGLKEIARDGDYLMNAMPLTEFQNAYKKSFVFRPGSKKLNQSGLIYQAGSAMTYFFMRSIFAAFPPVDAMDNIEVVATRLKRIEKQMALSTEEKPKYENVLARYLEYYRWAIKPHSSCIEFYE